MCERLDAGLVLLQKAVPLDERTYIGDVYRFMTEEIPHVFADLLDGLEAGAIVPKDQPQDPSLALRRYPRAPEDGLIGWAQLCEADRTDCTRQCETFCGSIHILGLPKAECVASTCGQTSISSGGSPRASADIWDDTGEVVVLTGNGVLVLEETEYSGLAVGNLHGGSDHAAPGFEALMVGNE